jgi:filamentous hemagglutinin family protein
MIKFFLPVTTVLLTLLPFASIQAQIVPDSSLPEPTIVEPGRGNTVEIKGGTRPDSGQNLFHSFREFSVLEAQIAHFNNAIDVQNIFARVTGGSISNIEGTIKAHSSANLFLLNPNGILFGRNAKLDIGGSFFATTAQSIKFADGTEFSATETQTTPLLTVSVPIGLQIENAASSIDVQGANLDLPLGETLALIGGDVNVSNGWLQAPGGRIELGGLAASGTVNLNNNSSLSFPDGVTRVDVLLTDFSNVDVRADGGGDISIHARNLNILAGSQIAAGISAGNVSKRDRAGDIEINATGKITLNDNSFITNSIDFNSLPNDETFGNGGDINVTTDSLIINNGSRLITSTYTEGNAGDININARNTISLNGVGEDDLPSVISSIVGLLGFQTYKSKGNAGDLNITTGSLFVTNGGGLVSGTAGDGNAGDVTIAARARVVFDGVGRNGIPSNVSSTVGLIFPTEGKGQGQGGKIHITAESLSVTNGAFLSTGSILGKGNAGNLILEADTISFKGIGINGTPSAAFSTLGQGIEGQGENIIIKTDKLSVTDGAILATFTVGKGDAGDISIEARHSVNISGVNFRGFIENPGLIGRLKLIFGFNPIGLSTGLYSSTELGGQGEGGNIFINTPVFRVADGAIINAQTLNTNNGGNIIINTDTFEATGGGQVITTTRDIGNAGEIQVNADRVNISGSDPTYRSRVQKFKLDTVRNQGAASGLFANTESNSVGDGGNIFLDANTITLQDEARITVDSNGRGRGGNIDLEADILTLDNRAFLSAETLSDRGGNITLSIGDLLLLRRNSRISTTAQGNGGNVTIDAGFLAAFPEENSDITANAFEGRGGLIEIKARGIFGLELRERLTPLSDITAFSQQNPQLDGLVTIDLPDVDIRREIVNLSVTPVDAETLISRNVCAIEDGKIARGSSFVVTGRGGLPPSADDPIINAYRIVEWATRSYETKRRENNPVVLRQPPTHENGRRIPRKIEQARGWGITSDGTLVLTAQAPKITPQPSQFFYPQCRDRS